MSILWTILIGFIAGVLAKLFTSGPNEPSGFILTTILGSSEPKWHPKQEALRLPRWRERPIT